MNFISLGTHQLEVIMKHPAKNPNPAFPFSRKKVTSELSFQEREIEKPEFFDSDLHDGDGAMMAEIYGSQFQKVWKKTRKKWWA